MERIVGATILLTTALLATAHPAIAETMELKCFRADRPTFEGDTHYWIVDFDAKTVTVANAPNGVLTPMPARITATSIDWEYRTNTSVQTFHIDRGSGVLRSENNGQDLGTWQCQKTQGF